MVKRGCKGVESNYGVIPLYLSGSTNLSRTQSLTEMFLDVCFAALTANGESYLMLQSRVQVIVVVIFVVKRGVPVVSSLHNMVW